MNTSILAIFLHFQKLMIKNKNLLLLIPILFLSNLIFAQADFKITSSVGCTDFNVGFSVQGIAPDSVKWDFGDGNRASGVATFNLYTDAGVFPVKMIAFVGGNTFEVTKSVTVHKSPVADFEFNKDFGCPPLVVNFKDKSKRGSSNIIKRTWGFADGSVLEGNITNTNQTFNSAGKRDISLIVEDENGCKSTRNIQGAIEILPKPFVDFDFVNASTCDLPILTDFTNKSDSLSTYLFQWNFGDGGSSTEVSPSHLYTKEGTFDVKLTATDANGCANTIAKDNFIIDENFSASIDIANPLGCDTLRTSFKPLVSSLYKKMTWNIDPELNPDFDNMTLYGTKPGEYNVELQVESRFGCVITASKKVYIDKKPIVDFIANDTLSCTFPFSVNFVNLTQNADSYNWNFAAGGTSTEENPTHTYNRKGQFNIRQTATSEHGCTEQLTKVRYIQIIDPVVEIRATNPSGCVPLNNKFSIHVENGFTVSQVQWDFGNGQTHTGINPPTQTYSSNGNYTVRAIVSFAEGCDNITVTRRIAVGSASNITASISSNSICPNQTLTGQVTPIAGATYLWSIGNLETKDTRTFSYKFDQSGTFPISVEVTSNGCVTKKSAGNVTVKPTAANFNVMDNCSGGMVTFRNNSYVGVESTWNFGDGNTLKSNDRIIEYKYNSYGTFKVSLTVDNKSTGCKDTYSQTIEVKASELDNYKIDKIKGCAPLEFSFQAPPGRTSNYWYLGEKERKDGPRPSFELFEEGSHDLMLVTVGGGCRDTLHFKDLVTVVQPEAGFEFDPIGGCSPIISTFTDTSKSTYSTIQKTKWDIRGVEEKHNVKSFTSTFDVEAIIPVTLYVEDNFGCEDSVTHDFIIARPFADFNIPSASFCTGNAFKPENLSTGVGLQYFWDFGDGAPIDTSQHPEHFYAKEGVFDMKLRVVDANNCENTKEIERAVTIQDIEYDFVGAPTSKYCPELLTEFSIIPEDITYRETIWDFGDGTVIADTTRNPKYIYLNSGNYDVTLFLEDYRGCTAVIKKENFIDLTGPSGHFEITQTSSCAPVEIEISADIKNSIANFWNFGDGTVIYDTNPRPLAVHVYEEPGVYTPSLTLDDGLGCIVTLYGEDVVVGGPLAQIDKTFEIACSSEDVEFRDLSEFEEHSPFLSRAWSFSDGYTTTDSVFSRNFDTQDSSLVLATLTVIDSLGCTHSVTDTLEVFKDAPLRVIPEIVICKGDSVQLSADRVRYYEWTPSSTLDGVSNPNPTVYPLTDTEYFVRGYISPTCYADAKVHVEVRTAFSGYTSADTTICIGNPATLWVEHDEINSGLFKYEWLLDNEVVGSDKIIEVSPEQTSSYHINVTNGACKDFRSTVHVEVGEYPELELIGETTILPDQEIRLEAISQPEVFYTWDPQPTSGCKNCSFAFVKPSETTTYQVTVTNKQGCSVTESITVDVIDGCGEDAIEIQNIFSPNNDGVNDFFVLKQSHLFQLERIRIYARTGELVYNSVNIDDAWDGTFNGEKLNSGVYVYYIEAQCVNGQPLLIKGNITLLR